MNGDVGNNTGIVIINTHEPEGEVAGRLLEIAQDKGYSPSDVVAQRGEHDASLSFRVPVDVAEAFDADRADRWPSEDELVDDDGDPNTPPVRKARPGKAPSKE